MRYWTQTKAPAGNWVDQLGTDDKMKAADYAAYLREHEKVAVRVIERTDTVIFEDKNWV